LRSCRNTAPQQDGDPVTLGRGERWGFPDDLGDVSGQALSTKIEPSGQ